VIFMFVEGVESNKSIEVQVYHWLLKYLLYLWHFLQIIEKHAP